MTPQQIALVRQSFAQVSGNSDAVAALFYSRLFLLEPSLKPMFRTDMKVQGGKLMTAIGAVVDGLDEPAQLLPVVRKMALRHLDYGVKAHHYDLIGAVLMWTLEQGLGRDFTREVRQAWSTAYRLLSATMIEAAYTRAA